VLRDLDAVNRRRCGATLVDMARLLLIEDDADLRLAMVLFLEDEGHRVVEAASGEEGLERLRDGQFDLILLDLRLPGMPGLDVCRSVRSTSIVPIIIVSARDDSHDLVAGLEAGADDYITKPVVPQVLTARIRALMRRREMDQAGEHTPVTVVGDVEIRPAEGVVLRNGEPVPLTKTEFGLLCAFAQHPRQVLTREQLLELVWGYSHLGDGRLVDSHIRRLRTKIERDPDAPTMVVTVRGLGYRLDTP
jgi:DNA-binding response OmpR family regulator